MPKSAPLPDPRALLAEAIQQAVLLHQQGQLEDAERLYRGVLELVPQHFDALHLLGVLHQQQGASYEALGLVTAALALAPDSVDALSNRGAILTSLRRYEEALADLDRATALKPDHVDALNNRGNVLRVVGRAADSLAVFDRVVALAPDHVDGTYNRAVTLLALDRPREALAQIDRALALQPGRVSALVTRGEALCMLGRLEEAQTQLERAAVLDPRNADAAGGLGKVLQERGRQQEALACFDGALALAPHTPDLLCWRGDVLADLGRFDEALEAYERALAVLPSHLATLNNRGSCLYQVGRYAEALDSFNAAIAINPVLASPHFNASLARICAGDFLEGWQQYEHRWGKKDLAPTQRHFAQPLWLGETDPAGKTILLHAEQGLGDTLHFVRYAPLLAARGARVILDVPAPLTALLAEMANVQVFETGAALPAFDMHCPLLSLPHAFKTTVASIPTGVPYLRAPPDRIETWRQRLPQDKSLRVGLAWAGKATQPHDRQRSIPLDRLIPLLGEPGVRFVSLQRDLRDGDAAILQAHPPVLHVADEFRDFADTAAVIAQLDLVISVDTSVAHLAGAMGKPLWVLLTFGGDWHWIMQGRDDSPWYPTARLFRQTTPGGWDSVVASLRCALCEMPV